MASTRARRLEADLTSSQPTKDDHRGNQTEQNGNRDATELACGCGVFPAVQPRAMPRRYGASYRRGGLKRWPWLVLEPSARTIAAWQDEQMFGAQQQVPRLERGIKITHAFQKLVDRHNADACALAPL